MTTVLVDGSSVGWRCLHAMGGLAHAGESTGMAFGFLRELRLVLIKVEATRCRIAWDGGRPQWRKALLPTYHDRTRQGQAAEEPERQLRREMFTAQQAWLKGVLPLMGVEQMTCADWEADDVIGMWWGTRSRSERYVIMSSDRDMWQLIGQDVSVYRMGPENEAVVTLDNFKDRTTFDNPYQWYWYRVLTGDASDHIPSVGKVGPVKGRALLAQGYPNNQDLLTPVQKAAAVRNAKLMSLRQSGRMLYDALDKRTVIPEWLDAQRNFRAARVMLDRAGMYTLTARWAEWSEPFEWLGRTK